MFVRLTTVKRMGKSYQYAQLVESHRPEPGKAPVHRVVANLGRVTDETQIENLRTALRANRRGERVGAIVAQPVLSRPRASLRYLDVAVVVRTLRGLGVLDELEKLLDPGKTQVAPAQVVAALVTQRCLEPHSKLHAVRWFPRTALPEILGIAPEHFNNTRVHRTLELLEQSEQDLMRVLSRGISEREGPFNVNYLDLTDTYFEGTGPELATRGKTKEGLIRKKVGIALLCGPKGEPLRWQVVMGNRAESSTMLDLMRTTRQIPWLANTPTVVDRAMGFTSYIRQMLEADVRFITALTVVELESYFPGLPAEQLVDLQPSSEQDEEACARQAVQRIEQAGFERVAENQLCCDGGLVRLPKARTRTQTQEADGIRPSMAMQVARAVEEGVASQKFRTFAAAARSLGYDSEQVKGFRKLRQLPEELQQRVLKGEVENASLRHLVRIARLDVAHRDEAFEQESQRYRSTSQAAWASTPQPTVSPLDDDAKLVRCVAYFNPFIFASQRRLAVAALAEARRHVDQVNERLRDNPGRRGSKAAHSEIEQWLRRRELASIFDVELEETDVAGTVRREVRLTFKKAEWQRRRRADGFTVLVADRRVELDAAQLCRTYRAKDAVETDFQVIKSVLKLRPVWHRTDLKIRAHVTLCMLALLVERHVHQRLSKRGVSARLAFELLEPGRLSVHQSSAVSRPTYVLTQPSPEQSRLLRDLRLTLLANDTEMQRSLTPRPTFVTTANEEVP